MGRTLDVPNGHRMNGRNRAKVILLIFWLCAFKIRCFCCTVLPGVLAGIPRPSASGYLLG